MDKALNASLFVNDGSFLERCKHLQQEKEKKNEIPDKSRAVSGTLANSAPKTVIGLDGDENDVRNHSDDVPMKRQKLGQPDKPNSSSEQVDFGLEKEQKTLSETRDSQSSPSGESSTPTGSDPIAMMEYYMKKAAVEVDAEAPKSLKG
ncbi:SURP and G-patch domain-containing protein 1-like protein [Dorcoceras hygrometricum]|uniref:SURP and G-patch domain-containing protein 1-like protein n=1 Tax=Dorcoceras hygrometricum TaxID=472368 RepID=A0A2Z7CLM6_9LAMI|nr:SURP and G-patch domain-containing protein 1-like protein [Dorcoceras hygrometricum]